MTLFNDTALLDFKRGGEAFSLRFPTDAQWLSYFRAREIFIKPKPGGGEITEKRRETFAALHLVEQLATEGTPIPTKDAAIWAADSLLGEFIETKIEAGCIVVQHRFLKSFESIHRLRFPTPQEDRELNNTIRTMKAERGWQRCIPNYEKRAMFYDELLIEAKGYVQPVPLGHKLVVVSEAFLTARKEAA